MEDLNTQALYASTQLREPASTIGGRYDSADDVREERESRRHWESPMIAELKRAIREYETERCHRRMKYEAEERRNPRGL